MKKFASNLINIRILFFTCKMITGIKILWMIRKTKTKILNDNAARYLFGFGQCGDRGKHVERIWNRYEIIISNIFDFFINIRIKKSKQLQLGMNLFLWFLYCGIDRRFLSHTYFITPKLRKQLFNYQMFEICWIFIYLHIKLKLRIFSMFRLW